MYTKRSHTLYASEIKSIKSFCDVTREQSKGPLELLHMDLTGPREERSIGGSRHILTIVVDYSRKIFMHYLKYKNEMHNKIREFIKRAENYISEKMVKKIGTDNGTEFLNIKLEQITKEKGMEHQFTTS